MYIVSAVVYANESWFVTILSCTFISFADWLGNELELVLVSRSSEPVRHEITLLLDKTFVAVLSMDKNTTAVSVCFDVKNSVRNTDIIQSALVTAVRRRHKFIFTLLSNGVVCILYALGFKEFKSLSALFVCLFVCLVSLRSAIISGESSSSILKAFC